MIRTVKVRKQPKPKPTIKVYFRPKGPIEDQVHDLEVTRIIMAVAPAEGRAPAYACVMGEIYDGDPMQRARKRIVLDEAVALDAADFDEEEQLRFQVSEKDLIYPTLEGLRRGLVALKDLWRPSHLILPPPEDSDFCRLIRATEGLSSYDRRQAALFPYWFPFYRKDVPVIREGTVVDHTEPLVGFAVPKKEDPEVNDQLRENLFSSDMLLISDTNRDDPRRPCRLWHTMEQWHGPMKRAMGLGLAWMQDSDMTYQIREWTTPEVGYIDVRQATEKEAKLLQNDLDDEIASALFMTDQWRTIELQLEDEAEKLI